MRWSHSFAALIRGGVTEWDRVLPGEVTEVPNRFSQRLLKPRVATAYASLFTEDDDEVEAAGVLFLVTGTA